MALTCAFSRKLVILMFCNLFHLSKTASHAGSPAREVLKTIVPAVLPCTISVAFRCRACLSSCIKFAPRPLCFVRRYQRFSSPVPNTQSPRLLHGRPRKAVAPPPPDLILNLPLLRRSGVPRHPRECATQATIHGTTMTSKIFGSTPISPSWRVTGGVRHRARFQQARQTGSGLTFSVKPRADTACFLVCKLVRLMLLRA